MRKSKTGTPGMGISLEIEKRRNRISMLSFGRRVRRAEVVRGISREVNPRSSSEVLLPVFT
ncbi:MAG: hypothetical protein JW836_15715 [Deltaproteobacteria bacterium]|nr:hypothetical protein [Deltaproteobacteria bacterium]